MGSPPSWHHATAPIFTPTCSRCGRVITAREEYVNDALCDDCLGLDESRSSQREAAYNAIPRDRPWWLSLWWLTLESTACILAIGIGASMLALVDATPPAWWLPFGIALVVLGPANVGLSVLLWMMRPEKYSGSEWSSLGRCLIVTKIAVSVALFPILVFSGFVLAVLIALVYAWLLWHRLS